LISTGGSSLKAVDALRDAGAKIKGMAAIFTYGFETAVNNFEEKKCELITLTDYDTLIVQALNSKYVSEDDLDSLRKWRENPEKWSV